MIGCDGELTGTRIQDSWIQIKLGSGLYYLGKTCRGNQKTASCGERLQCFKKEGLKKVVLVNITPLAMVPGQEILHIR